MTPWDQTGASSGIVTITISYVSNAFNTLSNDIADFGRELAVDREIREHKNAIAISNQMMKFREQLDVPKKVHAPPPRTSWQASVRAFRGRSGMR